MLKETEETVGFVLIFLMIGQNATTILINLLPIVIFYEQRVTLSSLWHFLLQFPPGQPRTHLKQPIFL